MRFKSEHDDEMLIQFRFHSDFIFRKHEINVKIIIRWSVYRFYTCRNKRRTKKYMANVWREKKKETTTTTTATAHMIIQWTTWPLNSRYTQCGNQSRIIIFLASMKYFEPFESAIVLSDKLNESTFASIHVKKKHFPFVIHWEVHVCI